MAPHFLLDGMLGSLARWLRIGGYDTEYRKDIEDDELIYEALSESRILLTRDEVLANRAKKRGANAVLIKPECDEEALALLSAKLGLTFDPTQSRCPKCNNVVEKVAKADVESRVPEGTYRIIDDYWACSRCGSVYWRGSHWSKIVETLRRASAYPASI
jgi:uncharacterized protein with PIN domain